MGKFPALALLLDVSFDDLNPGDGLGQSGVHRPELLTAGQADGLEAPVVIGHRDGQQDDKDDRDEQQLGLELADQGDGHDQGHQRIDDEHQAGAEHPVEHAHVVGGAGHDVADPLLAVKGLALAQ